MTDEEYQAKVNEYNSLVNEYNALVRENAYLEEEIETGIHNCYVVADNISAVAKPVTRDMEILSDNLSVTGGVIDDLYQCLVDLTEKYFTFKNLSSASKTLTQYNDIYFTKFKFYNELRRITLGYVIGIDSHIVSSERLRKKVEKAYLANTDYWLAYAISAVMLWASNEKEASYRALNKSISMDSYKSCVFFMLVNLRFQRLHAARNWFITLLDKTDVNNIREEWQHVLRLYLIGAFQNDRELQQMADSYFNRMLEQTNATNVNFSRKVADYSYNYAKAFIHKSDQDYLNMKRFCPAYNEMYTMLCEMEKIDAIICHMEDVYHMEEDEADNRNEEIENILYDLINSYDTEEFKVIRVLKLNEAIMAAKGDVTAANAKIQNMYGHVDATSTFGDLMLRWAFSEDYKATDITVKRFSMGKFKNQIIQGITGYMEECHSKLQTAYAVDVAVGENMPSLQLQTNEFSTDQAMLQIEDHFEKSKIRFIFADKYFRIFLFLCVCALLLLALALLLVKTKAFAVVLVLSIALGAVSGVLLGLRWRDVSKTLMERCEIAKTRCRNVLDEMRDWRLRIQDHYSHLSGISSVIGKF